MNVDEQCAIDRKEMEGYSEGYWKHASVLRNWFVAYGIGALALVIYNKGSFFTTGGYKVWFVGLVAAGISLQVLLTFLNKVIHWWVYYGKNRRGFQKTKRYKWSKKALDWFCIDITVDVLTFLFYGGALAIFIINL